MKIVLLVLSVTAGTSAFAQLSLNGQLRTRTEVRDGQGAPLPKGGYGHFFSTPLLASANVKNIPNAKLDSNWFYVMINIKPNFLFK